MNADEKHSRISFFSFLCPICVICGWFLFLFDFRLHRRLGGGGETGLVEGVIEAETVEIRGRVAGTISARSVKLYASARVDGRPG